MDTVYTILQTKMTRHKFTVRGKLTAEQKDEIDDELSQSFDIGEAETNLINAGFEILEFDENGIVTEVMLDCENIVEVESVL